MKRALITGITGQDGSYLADLLLAKGYEVHGIIRRASTFNTSRIDHLYQDAHVHGVKLFLHYGDLADSVNLVKLIYSLQPDEIYHLGAQSHVRVSFDIPEYTADVTGVGTIRILEAIREAGVKTRFYQASSSEMFGKVQEVPQTERTPFWPRSPYGVAKVFSYWATVNYRESYGLHANNGILFNHESPRRGERSNWAGSRRSDSQSWSALWSMLIWLLANVAIAPVSGSASIYYVDPDARKCFPELPAHFEELASFDKTMITQIPGERATSLLRKKVVKTTPLRNLLRENGITRVDLLQIDTEGYDYEVLKTFPFDLSLPVLACFEHCHLSACDRAAALSLVVSRGYSVERWGKDFVCVRRT